MTKVFFKFGVSSAVVLFCFGCVAAGTNASPRSSNAISAKDCSELNKIDYEATIDGYEAEKSAAKAVHLDTIRCTNKSDCPTQYASYEAAIAEAESNLVKALEDSRKRLVECIAAVYGV